MKRALLVFGVICGLVGCANPHVITQQEAGTYPHDYKERMRNYIFQSFKDPYTLKDTMLSKPMPFSLFPFKGYLVCFRANAKNSFGAYTGIQTQGYILDSKKINPLGNDVGCEAATLELWTVN